jgi:hypothetical protein
MTAFHPKLGSLKSPLKDLTNNKVAVAQGKLLLQVILKSSL